MEDIPEDIQAILDIQAMFRLVPAVFTTLATAIVVTPTATTATDPPGSAIAAAPGAFAMGAGATGVRFNTAGSATTEWFSFRSMAA